MSIAGHRVVVVVNLCSSRRWRTAGHRCGSEALKQRQQRHPDDQDSKDGFHAAILATGESLGNAIIKPRVALLNRAILPSLYMLHWFACALGFEFSCYG
jgi:hypothetical protein